MPLTCRWHRRTGLILDQASACLPMQYRLTINNTMVVTYPNISVTMLLSRVYLNKNKFQSGPRGHHVNCHWMHVDPKSEDISNLIGTFAFEHDYIMDKAVLFLRQGHCSPTCQGRWWQFMGCVWFPWVWLRWPRREPFNIDCQARDYCSLR